jgi:hypothetical protein
MDIKKTKEKLHKLNMKIKVKNIKIPRSFPYKDYTCKVDGHKFHAMLGEDGEGKLIADEPIYNYEDTLEHWIVEAQKMNDFYHNLVDFLKEVKYIHNQEKK